MFFFFFLCIIFTWNRVFFIFFFICEAYISFFSPLQQDSDSVSLRYSTALMIVLEDLVVVLEGSAVALGDSAGVIGDSAAALEGIPALGTMGNSGVF